MTFFRTFSFSSLAILAVYSLTSYGSAPAPLASKIQANDQEREKIKELLDAHVDELLKTNFMDPVEFSWLPGYIIKSTISRIDGAQAIATCIAKNKLKLVTVPEKWIYTIPEQYHAQIRQPENKNLVIVKKLEGSHEGVMTFEQARQVWSVLKNAKFKERYYYDMVETNILFCTDGRIAFIDTELNAWAASPHMGLEQLLDWIPLGELAKAYLLEQAQQLKKTVAKKAG